MANTTNFGWETPDDTDLVKDGALAIRTVAGAIDTSLGDLKGGTTNQVLAKNSNTDMDFKWVADATGIPATIFDAKGDLIAATAADTASRLAVGINGQILTADSAESTGLKWASSGGPTFRVGRTTSDQSISAATYTKVQFNNEIFDIDNCFDTSTNYRFTPTKAGYYQLYATCELKGNSGAETAVRIYKNGSGSTQGASGSVLYGFTYGSGTVSDLVYFNGSTDYVEIYVYIGAGTTRVGQGDATVFYGMFVRS